jgi:hypothetical protein
MRRQTVGFCALVLLTAVAAGSAPAEGPAAGEPGDPAVAAALARARAATDALSSTLVRRLEAEVAAGGTLAALGVCAEVAQRITAEQATAGLEVRRVTLRARNPVDRPREEERVVLERLATAHQAGEMPTETWAVEDGALRYFRPIVVRELCLRCHGDPAAFEPGVEERLAALYPEDAAVGYRVGDLRGAVAVRVELGERAQD